MILNFPISGWYKGNIYNNPIIWPTSYNASNRQNGTEQTSHIHLSLFSASYLLVGSDYPFRIRVVALCLTSQRISVQPWPDPLRPSTTLMWANLWSNCGPQMCFAVSWAFRPLSGSFCARLVLANRFCSKADVLACHSEFERLPVLWWESLCVG